MRPTQDDHNTGTGVAIFQALHGPLQYVAQGLLCFTLSAELHRRDEHRRRHPGSPTLSFMSTAAKLRLGASILSACTLPPLLKVCGQPRSTTTTLTRAFASAVLLESALTGLVCASLAAAHCILSDYVTPPPNDDPPSQMGMSRRTSASGSMDNSGRRDSPLTQRRGRRKRSSLQLEVPPHGSSSSESAVDSVDTVKTATPPPVPVLDVTAIGDAPNNTVDLFQFQLNDEKAVFEVRPQPPPGLGDNPNNYASCSEFEGWDPAVFGGRRKSAWADGKELQESPPQSSLTFEANLSPKSRLGRKASRVRLPSSPDAKSNAHQQTRPMKWKMGKVLGSGAQGRVNVAFNLDTGELMAVKTMEFDPDTDSDRLDRQLEQLAREIAILKSLDHESVVKYFFAQRDGSAMQIFMEFVPGGSLRGALDNCGALTEIVVVQYAHQVLCGLSYLHRNGVVHRDIKCANLLLAVTGQIKIADFGSAAKEDDSVSGMHGSPVWMAPEIFRCEGQTHNLSASDVWGFGCSVMEMLTGNPPWHHLKMTPIAVLRFIDSSEPITMADLPKGLSSVAKRMLLECFEKDPALRPDVDTLLNHEFFFSKDTVSESMSVVKSPADASLSQSGAEPRTATSSGQSPDTLHLDADSPARDRDPVLLALNTSTPSDQQLSSASAEQTQELRLRILEYIHDAQAPDVAHFRRSEVQTANVPTKDVFLMKSHSAKNMSRHYSYSGNRTSVSPSLQSTLRRAHSSPSNMQPSSPTLVVDNPMSHSANLEEGPPTAGMGMTRTKTLGTLRRKSSPAE